VTPISPRAVLTAAALCTLLAGCRIDEHNTGDNKDVRIATPFGGMQVKTNDAAVTQEIGLPLYPGATAVRNDNDSGAADVNLDFGSFRMRIKAASYRTADPPEKVEAFYRDSLRHFGDVIACRNGRASGAPAQTTEGLTCNVSGKHLSVDDSFGKDALQLKAGSKEHQHIVAIEPANGGTKIGLVALDLPSTMFHSRSEGDRQ
jgi:hypothetical protein